MKVISSLLLPAGLLAGIALVLNLPAQRSDQLESFLRAYPWVVLVVGILLALRFRRGRVVLALLALATADRVLLHFPPDAGGEAERFAFNATALVLPLDLLWLTLIRERGTFSPQGVLRLCVIAAQPALAAFLWLSYHPGFVRFVGAQFLPPSLPVGPALPHPAVIAFAGAALLIAVAWLRRTTPLEAGFLWALAASLVALTAGRRDATAYFATGGLILVVSVVEATFAMAYRDGLTSLPSRRAFDEALTKLSGRYTVAILDIDRFKGINDSHGHDAGDQVLRMVASRLAGVGGARAFRVGGEEFALVFAGRPLDAARPVLEEIRKGIASAEFTLRGEDRPRKRPKRAAPQRDKPLRVPVTVSVGAAESGTFDAPEDVVKAADAALYRAKRAGRNRVVP